MENSLHHKNILLGVTGSIAAYKAPELVRLLRQKGATVKVILTSGAEEFVTPLTLQALSEQPVYLGVPTLEQESSMSHIELAKWADAVLIAPASAQFIAKLAHGFCDDLLSLICICTRSPIQVVSAMNVNMWSHTVTQDNVNKILKLGYQVLGPAYGSQACGAIGLGRMLNPEDILQEMQFTSVQGNSVLKGKKILITAGPTHEPIDPIRYIGNNSTGHMGYALAEEAARRGANVTLISGPSCLEVPNHVVVKKVITSSEMLQAVMNSISEIDIFMSAAAVCDYTPEFVSDKKIKKTESSFQLHLKQTVDIVSSVAQLDRKPFVVGFAAETDHLLENAIKKLEGKELDLIVANLVGKDRGFGAVKNELYLITPDKQVQFIPEDFKEGLASKILSFLETNWINKK